MSTRHLPVRLNLVQLRHQARDLLLATGAATRCRRQGGSGWVGIRGSHRASLRKRLRGVEDETMHEDQDVTPLAWGARFHDQSFVSKPAMRLIAERGGGA